MTGGEDPNPVTAGLRLPVWKIEVFVVGEWQTQEIAHSEEDAIMIASSLVDYMREDNIRIVTPAGQIL